MTPSPVTKPERPVVTFSRDAVLTIDQVAAGLGTIVSKASKMDLPFFMVGARPRYIWGQVLDVLALRASKNGRPEDGQPAPEPEKTKGGLIVLRLPPEQFPAPDAPIGELSLSCVLTGSPSVEKPNTAGGR